MRSELAGISPPPTLRLPYASSEGMMRRRFPPSFMGGMPSAPRMPMSQPEMTSRTPTLNWSGRPRL
eukprot:CAMPEP_0177758540 /NCGR_PEP_ID=MMETSP0491_2-20121128/4242_1 /TAXON_ID=63592 /ORGANISM="Tetraselmis chuii, Strain PLY429" /LENGTH=65 /DNA_ID=CAMNT_0019274287 /DNA_START=386 /DNA_END=583 /DNA_ORIENTATION=+